VETAKQILEEIFHPRPSEVNEMIQSRLEVKSWGAGRTGWQSSAIPQSHNKLALNLC
jgi:hypothetical protein